MTSPTAADRSKAGITPDASRLARQELGLSQAAVSQASGVQAYILKQWEAGRFRPPVAALDKLRAYYEAEGVDLDAIRAHLAEQAAPGPVDAQQPKLGAAFTMASRPGFFVSDKLAPDHVGRLMARMEANDDRIAALVGESFETGFFGGISDTTEAKVRELMGTLAENYLLFRLLQGRNIVARTADQARSEPKTIRDFVAQWVMRESEAAELFVADPLPAGAPESSPEEA